MERRISHGNLKDNSLKNLIKREIQQFSKDKVEGCKNCEFRYACYDCRPDSISNDIYAKPYYCTYDVENGEWLDEDIVIDNEKVYVKNFKDGVDDLLKIKIMNNDYKIIDDIDKFCDEINKLYFDVECTCYDYDLDGEIIDELSSQMNVGMLDEYVLDLILEEYNKKLSSKKKQGLLKELTKIKNRSRQWILNGYTPQELQSNNITTKIGRNEKCPCGSGKKYKQCCGK